MKWNAISIQNQNGALGNLTQDSRSGRKGEDISQNAEQKSPKIEIEFLKERTVQETQPPNTRNSRKKNITGRNKQGNYSTKYPRSEGLESFP